MPVVPLTMKLHAGTQLFIQLVSDPPTISICIYYGADMFPREDHHTSPQPLLAFFSFFFGPLRASSQTQILQSNQPKQKKNDLFKPVSSNKRIRVYRESNIE